MMDEPERKILDYDRRRRSRMPQYNLVETIGAVWFVCSIALVYLSIRDTGYWSADLAAAVTSTGIGLSIAWLGWKFGPDKN